MSEVYGLVSNSFSLSAAWYGNGVPVNNTRASIPLGQTYIDIATNPRTIYQWDGQIWQFGGSATDEILQINADTGSALPTLTGVISTLGQDVTGSGISTSATGSTVSFRMMSPYALGNFSFSRSVPGGANILAVTNSSNTANSDAVLGITQGGASGGDAYVQYQVVGLNAWVAGLDRSDNNAFVFSENTALGTNNVLRLGTSGNVSIPLGNLSVIRSASGVTVESRVENTSNTANSNSSFRAVVGGTGAGDPVHQSAVTGAGSWTWGMDNSDSDAWVLALGDVLGTFNVLHVATGGNITMPKGSLTVTEDNIGGANVINVNNQDTTNALSHARMEVVTQTSGGNPWYSAIIVGQGGYSWGMDRADNHFKLTNSNTFTGGATLLDVYGTGEITMPLQPSFLGIAAAQANVVGLSATTYTVQFTTQVFDRGADFDGTTFTFPVSGIYEMNVTIQMSGLAVTNNAGTVNLVTTARTYTLASMNWGACMTNANTIVVSGSVLVDAVAGQTATVTVNIAGAADVVTIDAGNTTFSGKLEA